MINDLSINFEYEGLQHIIKVPTDIVNLPYNLAEAFREVINKSDANSDMVIEELINSFGFTPKIQMYDKESEIKS